MRCDGKVALVAGGGSGIGRATALLFAGQGAKVAVADLSAEGAEETAALVRAAGGEAISMQFDTTKRSETDRIVADTLQAFGAVHHVVSTVGWSDTSFFVQEDEQYWQRIININLLGSIYLSRSALEPLLAQRGGSIVLTSSDAGKVGTMGETVYAAAKAGVIGFVKSLARETARDNVRINAISPGPTDTPLLRAQGEKHVIDKMLKVIPLKRMATPEEQANAIVFLASDAASFVTGQTLSVSGGLTMTS